MDSTDHRPEPDHRERQPELGALQDSPWSDAEIADAKKRLNSPGPFFTSEQVHNTLKALEREWERTGGFDKTYMVAFLDRLREEDPPFYVVRFRE